MEKQNNNIKITIILPILNESGNIKLLYNKLHMTILNYFKIKND